MFYGGRRFMNTKNGLIITLLFLLLVQFVNADFVLQSEQNTGETCKGSTLLWNVQVTGKGDYTVNLEGGASAFSIAVPNGFTSLDNKFVYVYITPNSYVAAGDYDLKLVVNDNANTKKIPFVVRVKDCNTFSFTGDTDKKVCGCESVKYNYNVKNTGGYDDKYILSLKSDVKNWFTLSQEKIDLKPGEEKTITVTAKSSCNNFGDYLFSLNADSENNVHAVLDNKITVDNCFDYNLNLGKEYAEMCEHSIEQVEVGIENTAVRANTYTLKLDGPGWANIQNKEVTLGSGVSGKTFLILNPDYRIEGEFNNLLTVKGDKGEIVKEKILKVKVKKCNDFSLDVIDAGASICQGTVKGYNVHVVNNGEIDKEIKISTDNENAKLNLDKITLVHGESKDLLLTFNSGNLSAGKYEVNVKGNSLDDSGITSQDVISFEVLDKEKCYAILLTADDVKVKKESQATMALQIRNLGVEQGSYEIGVSGDAAGFVQINPGVIDVKPGETQMVYGYIAPSRIVNPAEYDLRVNVKNKESGVVTKEDVKITVGEAGDDIGVITPEKENFWKRFSNWLKNLGGKQEVNLEKESTTTTLNIDETTTTLEETTTTLESTTTSSSTTLPGNEFPQVDIRYNPSVSESVMFGYKNETHSMIISEVGEKSVTLIFESESLSLEKKPSGKKQSEIAIVILNVNETKNIDIDGDGKEDIRAFLKGIGDGKPDVELSLINKEEVSGDDEGKNYTNYIIIGVVVLALILLIAIFSFQSSDSEEVESGKETKKESKKDTEHIEDDEPDDGNFSFGKYLLLLILIAAAVWLGFKYQLWDEISDYRYYVILGFVVLILLILIIKYWNSIVEFFEEDIEDDSEDAEKKGEEKSSKKTVVEKSLGKKETKNVKPLGKKTAEILSLGKKPLGKKDTERILSAKDEADEIKAAKSPFEKSPGGKRGKKVIKKTGRR